MKIQEIETRLHACALVRAGQAQDLYLSRDDLRREAIRRLIWLKRVFICARAHQVLRQLVETSCDESRRDVMRRDATETARDSHKIF